MYLIYLFKSCNCWQCIKVHFALASVTEMQLQLQLQVLWDTSQAALHIWILCLWILATLLKLYAFGWRLLLKKKFFSSSSFWNLRLLIRLRCRLSPSHSDTFRSLVLDHWSVALALCCVYLCKLNLANPDWNRFSLRIALYLASSSLKGSPTTWSYHHHDEVLRVMRSFGFLPNAVFCSKANMFNFGLIRPENLFPSSTTPLQCYPWIKE